MELVRELNAVDFLIYTPAELNELLERRRNGFLEHVIARGWPLKDDVAEGLRWLRQAENDPEYIRIGPREGFFAQVCFQCQQICEKALKAISTICGSDDWPGRWPVRRPELETQVDMQIGMFEDAIAKKVDGILLPPCDLKAPVRRSLEGTRIAVFPSPCRVVIST